MDERDFYVKGERVVMEEDRYHEFKRCTSGLVAVHVKKYVNAFLNTDGGTLYCGIEDNGVVRGMLLTRKQRDDIHLTIDSQIGQFRPQVDPSLLRVRLVPVQRSHHPQQARSPTSPIKSKKGRKGARLHDDEIEMYIDEVASSKHHQQQQRKGRREYNADDQPDLFVLEIHVSKGISPVYFNNTGHAFIKRDGSVEVLDVSLVQERLSRAWKVNASANEDTEIVSPELVGRESEIKLIEQRVFSSSRVSCHVVCLFGPAGAGKSALAQRLAERFRPIFPHNWLFVSLKGFENDKYLSIEDAMTIIIHTKFPEKHIDRKDSGHIRSEYNHVFSGKRSILVIENCSNLSLVTDLLPRAHDALVLVTSRRRIEIESFAPNALNLRIGELSEESSLSLVHYFLPSLTASLSLQLARAASFLPLAIRVLSSQLKRLSLSRIEGVLARLSAPDESADHPKAKLAESIGLIETFNLLEQEQKSSMMLLSIFATPFDPCAAASVFALPVEETEELLFGLVEESLLTFDGLRFAQNDLLRSTVRHLMVDATLRLTATRRYVMHYSNLLFTLSSPDKLTTECFQSDMSHFLEAFRCARDVLQDSSETLRLARLLYPFRFCLPRPIRASVETIRNTSMPTEKVDENTKEGEEAVGDAEGVLCPLTYADVVKKELSAPLLDVNFSTDESEYGTDPES